MKKKFTYDGKSRPSNDLYKKEFDRIFGKSTAQLLEEIEIEEDERKIINNNKGEKNE